ncbi:hypothetical protein KVP40.0225 [Vibrio phage KVP40]|uniref:Uncharacterized protein n=3 Tax=Schizotequatrovirus KVP40 TaxID=1914019 RepID=Q6WHS9_BPKVM|nr:hypothetical protein KVP40.0225 [Vibrio phage KVP40]AFN37455.1 hypothetical protein pp2_222 [Vibrio phage phi-pp2]QIW91189.1 hypothetical protein COHAPHLL_00353 [Vibrio phage V09]UNA01740.1 hypothetical protein [Vibrio phage PC-Liy1]URQ03036.1 hypothetical protein PVA8_50 [Vibrio phage PVA8]WBM58772.1 hypothetical protein vBValMPVA8_50 [Vibrio phage vB_ValM_PVA8]
MKQSIWLPHVSLTYFHAFLVLVNLWTASTIYEYAVPMLIGLIPGIGIGMSVTLVVYQWEKNSETFVADVKKPIQLLLTKIRGKIGKQS